MSSIKSTRIHLSTFTVLQQNQISVIYAYSEEIKPRTLEGLVVKVDLLADLGVTKLGCNSLLSDAAQRGDSGGVNSLYNRKNIVKWIFYNNKKSQQNSTAIIRCNQQCLQRFQIFKLSAIKAFWLTIMIDRELTQPCSLLRSYK